MHVINTIGTRRKVVGELAVSYLAFVANPRLGIGGRRKRGVKGGRRNYRAISAGISELEGVEAVR